MTEIKTDSKRVRLFSILEVLLIVLLAAVPLFLTFPYRVNIFLSWEGAYRMSQGQIPYKDFGMPLGYMYWVIPAFFFKVFGPQLISLVKAQVLINILSGLAFRSVLKHLGVQPGIRLLSVLLYCLSYSFFNFWPWYNHTVIVYEMIALAFLTRYVFAEKKHWIWLSLSALFVFFSFFTKQDGGALALLICLALLVYHCFYEKKWSPLLIFAGSFAVVCFAIIAPLTRYSFGYWFNHGQAPHTSRFSSFDIVDEFFTGSQWIKFYIFLILLLAAAHYKNWKELLTDKRSTFFLLLTLGILAEAAILQVTSYTPPDNNIFFHSFAFAFIMTFLAGRLNFNFTRTKPFLIGLFGLLLWWSGVSWKYVQRVAERMLPASQAQTASTENLVNKKTFMISNDPPEIPVSEWTFAGLKTFDKIYMPKPTVEGIQRLMQNDVLKKGKDLRLLNMTELTPLAAEIPFQLETGTNIPLWYHLGVSMFNREAAMYEKKIASGHYDLVLFEHIPTLNNFYPFRVRDSLQVHYRKLDSFPAPRRGDTQGMIEVYGK
ncbi:MAG TPA: hypothetical protein VFR58_13815 [Flavisolibacter sp.]|nr:hypothetical protein [Flavisolibacter sp.]